MENLRRHIGGDTVTVADLAGHRATLLQGPRFVGTWDAIADQMEEWFDEEACDGFVVAATRRARRLRRRRPMVVPELQRRGCSGRSTPALPCGIILGSAGRRLAQSGAARRGLIGVILTGAGGQEAAASRAVPGPDARSGRGRCPRS